MSRKRARLGFEAEVETWAQQQFGACDLGDSRRTQRLVDYATRQALQPGEATHVVCGGDDAVTEATYRWLRNPGVDPAAVEAGPFQVTAEACAGREVVLAVQDTTNLVFPHSAADDMGPIGSVEGHRVAGVLVHSTLMVDPSTRAPLGLLDQHRWTRSEKPSRSKAEKNRCRKKTPYREKEGVKWEEATARFRSRLQDPTNTVTVCDREADIYELLAYLVAEEQRFVIRASRDRRLFNRDQHLFHAVSKRPIVATRAVQIAQRGKQRSTTKQHKREGREGRVVDMAVRACSVDLAMPQGIPDAPASLRVAVVHLKERRPAADREPVEWFLLTSEPIDSPERIEQIVSFYECRWLIEEFHKAWKSGCRIEERRLQSLSNLERLMTITATIAVRLLQLRALARHSPDSPCSAVLSEDQWKCLQARMEPSRKSKRPPSLDWAMKAIARLGGWRDTKRTGQIGWQPLWRGWTKLEQLAEGWALARERC